jgi:hypothetical protein
VSSSGYIDANAIRLEDTAKAFSSNAAVFTQDVVISTTPLYFIARSDVGGSATEGTFELALQVYTTAITVNNPIAFSNATDVVAPPSGTPSGFSATPSGSLLQVSLSWGGVTGAESYTIYRATYSGLTTNDFLLTMTTSTTFTDNYIPPTQQLYYKVFGTNRAGTSSGSASAGATAVDVPALTTSYIYERVGSVDYSNLAYGGSPSSPHDAFIDRNGNIFIAATFSNLIMFLPAISGTYFGQPMVANSIYTIAGTGSASGSSADGGAATAGTSAITPGEFVWILTGKHLYRGHEQSPGTIYSHHHRDLFRASHDGELYLHDCREWHGVLRGRWWGRHLSAIEQPPWGGC